MVRLRPIVSMSAVWMAMLLLCPRALLAQAPDATAVVKLPQVPEPSPLLVEPKTPEDLFRRTLLMVDLARMDLARQYLEQVEAALPNDDLLTKIRTLFGTAEFVKLAGIKELQPVSIRLLNRLSDIGKRRSEDPAYIEELLVRVLGNSTEREQAIVELKNAGPLAVPHILKMIGQAGAGTQQNTLVLVLSRMGREIVPPLLGGLDAPEERIQIVILDLLGWLNAQEAIPYLWYPAFSDRLSLSVRDAAQRVLAKLLKGSPSKIDQISSVLASNQLRYFARRFYRDRDILPLKDDGSVALWGWDKSLSTVASKSYDPSIAALLISAKFANQSLALSPEQPEMQAQYLASLLGSEVLQNGWGKPLPTGPGSASDLALTAGEETVSRCLAEAIDAGQSSTAVATLNVLAQIGTREQIYGSAGLKSPVIAALNAPDSRIQFAAAVTVLRIGPKNGFTGSSRVVSILARALTDSGRSRALIVDADESRSGVTAGYLRGVGYQATTATTGREGFEKATTEAGIDLIVVHANCIRWDLTQTISNLRSDSRTSAVPIVIYGPESVRTEVARLVSRSKLAVFVSESASDNDFLVQFQPFVQRVRSPELTAYERNQQKIAAVYWLASLASDQGVRVFDIAPAEQQIGRVAEVADTGENALVALAGIGTGSAQKKLSVLVLNTSLDMKLRETAATQLTFHIQRFGLLLTQEGIAAIHSAWLTTQDPAIKTALAGVVGTLRPSPAVVGQRLQQFAASTGQRP